MLVLIGADAQGRKELLAIEDGYRESAQSWRELLLRLRDENGLVLDSRTRHRRRRARLLAGAARGLAQDPAATMLGAQDRQCAEQAAASRCRARPSKTCTGSMRPRTAQEAEAAFDRFVAKYGSKYDKAVTCLTKDREALLAFYDFPAEHWKHIRTSQSDREHLRHRPATHRQDQRLPVAPDGTRHGLQARQVGRATLAPAGRLGTARPGHRGRALPRRRTRSSCRGASRCLTPNTNIDHSSRRARTTNGGARSACRRSLWRGHSLPARAVFRRRPPRWTFRSPRLVSFPTGQDRRPVREHPSARPAVNEHG